MNRTIQLPGGSARLSRQAAAEIDRAPSWQSWWDTTNDVAAMLSVIPRMSLEATLRLRADLITCALSPLPTWRGSGAKVHFSEEDKKAVHCAHDAAITAARTALTDWQEGDRPSGEGAAMLAYFQANARAWEAKRRHLVVDTLHTLLPVPETVDLELVEGETLADVVRRHVPNCPYQD